MGIFFILCGLVSANPAIALKFEHSLPAALLAQVQGDLKMMNEVTGSGASPLHKAIYGAVEGAAYTKWFEDRVSSMGYDRSYGSAAMPVAAYNDSNSSGHHNHMMITDYFLKGNLPQIARIASLFHEARHSEHKFNYWNHATCPKPFLDEEGNDIKSIYTGTPLAGLPGCDKTYLGAYGTSIILMRNLARYCSNCTEKLKADADIYSANLVLRLLRKEDRAKITADN